MDTNQPIIMPCQGCEKWMTEAKTLGDTVDELLKANEVQHKRLMVAVYGFEEDATLSDTLVVIEKLREAKAEHEAIKAQLAEAKESVNVLESALTLAIANCGLNPDSASFFIRMAEETLGANPLIIDAIRQR